MYIHKCIYIYTHFYVCNTRLFVYSYVSGEKEREGERERDIYIYWLKAQDTSGSRQAEPKKEEGMKPERGESKPTAAVL